MRAPVALTNPYALAARLPEGDALEPAALLGGGAGPIEIDIGPGRGGFLFERLAASPDVRLIGFEVRLKWAFLVDERLRSHGLAARARVFAEDAGFALPRLAPATVRAVFIHFPDPWWKRRHRKRKVTNRDLLSEIARVVAPGGEFFYQTDVLERADEVEAMVSGLPEWSPWGSSARVQENPYGAMSPRERRAVADGLPIARLRYRRRGGSGP